MDHSIIRQVQAPWSPPFHGETTQSIGDFATPYSFASELTDASGLLYLRARYYDPATGRFFSRDTWQGEYQNPLSLNKFAYANGNPIVLTDPSGLSISDPSPIDVSGNPFGRFDRTIDYIYNEMVTNAKGHEAAQMRSLITLDNNQCITFNDPQYIAVSAAGQIASGYLKFFSKVRSGGDWDHKPKLRAMLNIQDGYDSQYYPLRGNDQFEVFYDIWSNIHYGYVGSSIGFNRDVLQGLANLEVYAPEFLKETVRGYFGQYDPGDVISVDIGVTLWSKFHYSLTRQDLHNEILAKLKIYFASQDTNGNGKIDEGEINPKKGKLMPKGSIHSDWQ